jgi:hypothetical protein
MFWRTVADLPTAYPLRDLFDAAVRHRTVKLTCTRCRHSNSFHAAALWWLFQRNGWKDRFEDMRKRSVCLHCWRRHGVKIRNPRFELTEEPPLDVTLAMPSELEWKRELRRRR